MTLRRSLLSAAVFATACGGSSAPGPRAAGEPAPDTSGNSAPPTPAPAAAPRQLATETAIRTAWNATLTVPASWWITESSEVVQVQDPERELTLSFLATPAADRDAAIATAWKRVAPGFSLPVAQAAELGGRDGWDALAQVAYVTKTEESRIVLALARRKGDTWHVTTIDGKYTAVDRRGAQINALILDMKVPGVDKESFAGRTASVDAAHLAKFDAFVEEARKLTHVPGVAVAVVHGGKIVFEKGYGVRSLRGKQAVTPSTLFMIGSTTKSLTTLMMARLVDQKKFAWTTPVTEVLPAFALADPEVTKKVTVQHTVCACTGMPRQDYEFLFEYDGWDPERRLASLATMKPTTGFGETFQYSNSMVATGGWIGGHAFAPRQKLGPAYDAAMKELVFGPLGMSATTFDVKVATGRDHATSHGHGLALEYQTTPIDYERGVNAMRPAGGAWSNARDMARYLMLELARGKTPDGKQLVSEDNLLERRNPRVKIDANTAYGLGLFVAKENGAAVVHHGGNMLGYTSDMFLLPDQDIGVVVLTNAGGANAFRSAVHRAFLEIVFDGKPEARKDLDESIERTTKALEEQRALLKPVDDAWIGPLLGRYTNGSLGRLELRKQGKTFVVDAGEWKSAVTKLVDRDGSVKVMLTDPPYAGLELVPKAQDGKPVLVLEAGQHVYAFVRE